MIKEFLKKTFIGKIWNRYLDFKNRFVQKFIIPSYEEKRSILLSYKKRYDLNFFVETGTFLGDTVEYFKNAFEKIYSIELAEDLAKKAKLRFASDENVSIIQGDSGEVLKALIEKINKPILFWLDGHYSSEFFIGQEYIKTARGEKETPVEEEIRTIIGGTFNHVILIDDARCFNGRNDYPTISELRTLIHTLNPTARVSVKRDIIRITPN